MGHLNIQRVYCCDKDGQECWGLWGSSDYHFFSCSVSTVARTLNVNYKSLRNRVEDAGLLMKHQGKYIIASFDIKKLEDFISPYKLAIELGGQGK